MISKEISLIYTTVLFIYNSAYITILVFSTLFDLFYVFALKELLSISLYTCIVTIKGILCQYSNIHLTDISPCFCLHPNMCGYPTKHQLQQEAVNSGLNALFSPHPWRRFDNTSRKGGQTGLLGSENGLECVVYFKSRANKPAAGRKPPN